MAAVGVTVVSIGVAVVVNLLTSDWSWLVFAVLACLAAVWVGLEVWRTPRSERRRPSIAVPVAGGFVARPELTDEVVRALTRGKRTVGITTGLAGAGGFGKTTLAAQVMEHPDVLRRFASRYWVTVGQEVRGAALADTVNDVIERVSDRPSGLTSPEQAGMRLGELLAGAGATLVIVDDVWTAEQLRPFLIAGRHCTLLITTRIPDLLPATPETATIRVDQMNPAESRELLGTGLPGLPDRVSLALLERTGRWPLALRLANSALRRTARDGGDVVEAADRLLLRLAAIGPTALDVTDAAGRDRTVAATLESSLGVLGDRRERALDMAIFPEDTEIPVDIVAALWRSSADFTAESSADLVRELAELSLITREGDRVRLHDVIRTYLRHECGPNRLALLHDGLLATAEADLPGPWWTMPRTSSTYLWRFLAYHLDGAGRHEELGGLVTSPDWIIGRLRGFGPVAVAEDLAFLSTPEAVELARYFDQFGHLLISGDIDHSVINALAHRLPDTPAFTALRDAALDAVDDLPRLVPWRPLPDAPDPALSRVLAGHEYGVDDVVYSPDGSWLASAAIDGLRVWAPDTGRLLRLVDLGPHRRITRPMMLSRDGALLAVMTSKGVIVMVETATWQVRGAIDLEVAPDACTLSGDGRRLVIAAGTRLLVVDLESGRVVRSFASRSRIRQCHFLDHQRVLVANVDSIQVWSIDTGLVSSSLRRRSFARELAVGPDLAVVAVITSSGVEIWDIANLRVPPIVLRGDGNMNVAEFTPDGVMLAVGFDTGIIAFWDTCTWKSVGSIAAHGGAVECLATSPHGDALASGSDDDTVRLWNSASLAASASQSALNAPAEYCASATDGTWVAIGAENSVAIHAPAAGDEVARLNLDDGYFDSLRQFDGNRLLIPCLRGLHLYQPGGWHAPRVSSDAFDIDVVGVAAAAAVVCSRDPDGDLAIWDMSTWDEPQCFTVRESGIRPRVGRVRVPRLSALVRKRQSAEFTVAVSPSGEWVAVHCGRSIHIIHPTESIAPIASVRGETELSVSPDGRSILVRDEEGARRVSAESWTVGPPFADPVWADAATDVAWSPDSSLIAAVFDDRVLRVHDSVSGTTLAEFKLDGELNACTWVTDVQLVVVGVRGTFWFLYEPGGHI
ncbi:NB-ARC domain-containing protein [Actinokineospora guangxiensis]|uniref:NB-ARC domain-containing protein n=1 Tax=Actinokineospora guangxiensis TaxID=1490288 RepID=A0ABW0EGP8_9PSEU